MRDRHWPVGFDLLPEKRHNRTGRVQDIAETHHCKTGCGASFSKGLQDDFRNTLACAHYIRRAHCLVC